MGLAGSRRTERNAVLSFLDPIAPRQFQNQRLVERGLRGEVEGVEALDLRKAREANATFDVAPLAIDALQFAQSKQIARVVGAILRRLHRHLLILAREGRQLQRLEMIAEQHLGRDGRDRRGLVQ
jgi:hypothetical protein